MIGMSVEYIRKRKQCKDSNTYIEFSLLYSYSYLIFIVKKQSYQDGNKEAIS
jgi:hypothetical protein